MHDDEGERGTTIILPMAEAQQLDIAFDLEQSALGRGQRMAARQEMAYDRLQMAAMKAMARDKVRWDKFASG